MLTESLCKSDLLTESLLEKYMFSSQVAGPLLKNMNQIAEKRKTMNIKMVPDKYETMMSSPVENICLDVLISSY